MICADVVGITLQHALKNRNHFESAVGGLAVAAPVLPGAQQHDAFGIERSRLGVVGETLIQFAHRVFVIDAQFFQIGVGRVRVTFGHRFDVGPFGFGGFGSKRHRFLNRVVGQFFALRLDVGVDVRAECHGYAPVSYRQFGVEFGSVLE